VEFTPPNSPRRHLRHSSIEGSVEIKRIKFTDDERDYEEEASTPAQITFSSDEEGNQANSPSPNSIGAQIQFTGDEDPGMELDLALTPQMIRFTDEEDGNMLHTPPMITFTDEEDPIEAATPSMINFSDSDEGHVNGTITPPMITFTDEEDANEVEEEDETGLVSEAELEELRNSLSPPIVPNNISSKGVFPKKYYAFLTTSTGFTNAEFVEFLKANGQNFVEAGFDGGEEDIDEIEDESFGNSQPKQYYPIHAAKEPVQWEELKQRILQFGASRLRNPYKNRFEHGGSHSSIWKEIYRRKSKFLKTIMWFQHPTS
jgi:hypothetical protein